MTATQKPPEPHMQEVPLLWTHLSTESLEALSLAGLLSPAGLLSQHIPGKG